MLIQDILNELPIASDWYKMCGDRYYRMFYHNLDNDVMHYPFRNGTEPCKDTCRIIDFRVVRRTNDLGYINYYWDMII